MSWCRAVASAVLLAAVPASATSKLVEPGIAVEALAPRGVRVWVEPRSGESWRELAQRLTGGVATDIELWPARHSSKRTGAGAVEVAFARLTLELRREVIASLLPLDRCDDANWRHVASTRFAPDASYETLARWLALDDASAARIEQALRASAPPEAGRAMAVPLGLVAPWLREARCLDRPAAGPARGVHATTDLLLMPVPSPAADEPVLATSLPLDLLPSAVAVVAEAERREAAAGRVDLAYGHDPAGAYASYRLKAGEAVYSSVIVRFTGRVHAGDVNELVPVIAARSGVRSFRDLPVGFEIKVPLEFLAAEFLPESDARRREHESRQRDVARYRNRQRATALSGVVVVLDAGHGGNDRGASSNGVWESDYVYDIMCRVKRQLERETEARVVPLVRNAEVGYKVRDGVRLRPLRTTAVLTDPPYPLEDATVGVNLRWYLANSVYRQLVRQGTDPSRIVFTSVHADSLHPTVRGAMVYVPGEEHTDRPYGTRNGIYQQYREVRQAPLVRPGQEVRRRDEGLSREFARLLLIAFGQHGLPTHDQKPVRGSVLRNGREWLPAVLRANQIPARVLLEVCNLNHPSDNELLQSPAFRQAVAESYVAALLAYYGNDAETLVARE